VPAKRIGQNFAQDRCRGKLSATGRQGGDVSQTDDHPKSVMGPGPKTPHPIPGF